MQVYNQRYVQSISKTFHALTLLNLYEAGKIIRETPIPKYLPTKISSYVTHAEKITVKMLLNHASGVPEYNFNPNYIGKPFQNLGYDLRAKII